VHLFVIFVLKIVRVGENLMKL